jgi:peptidoglycan/LPS O-acetylase OafA/YrhL
MVGAIGAIVFFQQKMEIVNLLSNKFVQLISWILFILMGLNVIQIPAVIGQEIIAAASLSMILGQVTINNRLINLETKIFDFVGKISYGIYVIHPLIILILSGLYKNLNIYVGLRYLLVYSSVIAFTLLFSWIIYTYFEMPFLRLKKKHAIIQSSNSMFQ